ncbi:hypothetical protein M378DRAFT_994113 [Amanita muscaria Koide BX008]|uniref:Secreted protein n=1 Tax=Amanita muscaria (strain Koide BX008) TaxID=946122 RepID=A0A0C2X1H5_AMAMK|nr:hypothetical protein M378DRAFT_994113 [Amanita muscaria Koide BX008]
MYFTLLLRALMLSHAKYLVCTAWSCKLYHDSRHACAHLIILILIQDVPRGLESNCQFQNLNSTPFFGPSNNKPCPSCPSMSLIRYVIPITSNTSFPQRVSSPSRRSLGEPDRACSQGMS